MRTRCVVLLLALGAWQLTAGLWAQGTAALAQALIARAWARTLEGAVRVEPWPWAATWPVARLAVPRLGVERYVLAGADGAALAFGPGHAAGTALPGEAGNSLIGGHRDSHLAFLRELRAGDEIAIERADGEVVSYQVGATLVLDRRDAWIASQEGVPRLTLVSCTPFDARRAAGAQRYAVVAPLAKPPDAVDFRLVESAHEDDRAAGPEHPQAEVPAAAPRL